MKEKTFANFVVLWLHTKVFSAKFGVWHPLARQKEQSVKVFSTKIVFFTNSWKFSPSKVSRYTVLWTPDFSGHARIWWKTLPEVSWALECHRQCW